MFMDNFTCGLFELLNDSSDIVTNDKLDKSYEKFIEKVKQFHQSENEYTTVIHTLNVTRIEFKALQMLSQYGQGEKCA